MENSSFPGQLQGNAGRTHLLLTSVLVSPSRCPCRGPPSTCAPHPHDLAGTAGRRPGVPFRRTASHSLGTARGSPSTLGTSTCSRPAAISARGSRIPIMFDALPGWPPAPLVIGAQVQHLNGRKGRCPTYTRVSRSILRLEYEGFQILTPLRCVPNDRRRGPDQAGQRGPPVSGENREWLVAAGVGVGLDAAEGGYPVGKGVGVAGLDPESSAPGELHDDLVGE